MNEICKQRTAERMTEALKRTNLKQVEIASRLDIPVINYISMIKRPNQYPKIPNHAWEKFRQFVNSGETIENYQFEKYSDMMIKKADNPLSIDLLSHDVKTDIIEKHGKYILNIDIIITLNGKRIEVGK